jgi:hypothetical protein
MAPGGPVKRWAQPGRLPLVGSLTLAPIAGGLSSGHVGLMTDPPGRLPMGAAELRRPQARVLVVKVRGGAQAPRGAEPRGPPSWRPFSGSVPSDWHGVRRSVKGSAREGPGAPRSMGGNPCPRVRGYPSTPAGAPGKGRLATLDGVGNGGRSSHRTSQLYSGRNVYVSV